MNYLLKSRDKGAPLRRKVVVGILVFYCAVVGINAVIPNIFDAILIPVAKPLWKSESAFLKSLRNIPLVFISKEKLQEENRLLKEHIDGLRETEKNLELLKSENATLTAMLGRTRESKMIEANILRTPPFSPYDSLLIDAGTEEGVEMGDHVFIHDIPAGKISESFRSTAKVTLYSTYGESTTVLLGASTTHMTALGRGGGAFEIAAPRDFHIKKGDTVTLPEFPGAVFGIVEEVISDPARAFQTILFISPFNMKEITKVLVMKQ